MRQPLSQRAALSSPSFYASAFDQSLVTASDEVDLTERYIWKKRALYIKNELGIISRMDWATALGLTPSLLLEALREAEKAESRLLAMGLRLSLKLAEKQYSKVTYIDFHDYIQDSLVIFFDAVETFDPSRGTRLSTYTYCRIKFYFANFSRLREVSGSRCQEHSNYCNEDYLVNDFEFQENVVNVRKALRSLPDRQRLVMEKKFGIQGKVQPVHDIAKDFGVSCKTIRKDEKKAIAALADSRHLKPHIA